MSFETHLESTEPDDESLSSNPQNTDVDWRAVRTTLDQIGRKWQPSIIDELLADNPQRFGELEERLDGISSATLSTSLDDLQEKGLVNRRVLDTKPVRVEYELTERGQSLEPVLDSLVGWGKENVCTKKLLQNKHHPAIIYLLLIEGELYFSDLKETIGLTSKSLSNSLEQLQEYEIIHRNVRDKKPVRVEYSLTNRGKSLTPVFESLSTWGKK